MKWRGVEGEMRKEGSVILLLGECGDWRRRKAINEFCCADGLVNQRLIPCKLDGVIYKAKL